MEGGSHLKTGTSSESPSQSSAPTHGGSPSPQTNGRPRDLQNSLCLPRPQAWPKEASRGAQPTPPSGVTTPTLGGSGVRARTLAAVCLHEEARATAGSRA